MKINCMLDKVQYNNKPLGYEVGKIQNRIENAKIEIDITELSHSLSKGCTFKPGYLNGRKESDWIQQQIFALDFDNDVELINNQGKSVKRDETISLEEQYKRDNCSIKKDNRTTIDEQFKIANENNIYPIFAYTSFSSTKEKPKFRFVFCVNEAITDFDITKKIQLILIQIFNKADEHCKDLSRLYFGGKELIYEGYNNLIDYKELIDKYSTIITDKVNNIKTGGERVDNILNEYIYSPNILSTKNPPQPLQSEKENYNIKAIVNRDVEFLRNKINNNHIEFENASEFWHYVYHNINMAELLEFKYPKSIKCIFHEDHNPSASIYQNNEGVWLYTCHGKCNLTMNVKQLIETLGNFKSEYKSIKFIKDIFNLSIKETDWSIEQKANLDRIIENLNLNNFADLCPQANKNIRYVKELFRTMLSIAKNNVYGENYMNSDGDVVFFVSLVELAKKMEVSQNHISRISQRLAVLTYHDLVRKLDDNKIPEKMLKKAQALAIEKGTDKHVNFYSIPSWVFEHLIKVERQGEKWKQYGYSIKGTSYEMFYRAEGKDIAQGIYPQHKKVKTETIDHETGEITINIEDRTTSRTSDRKVEKIINTINNLINIKGYTTEKELILSLSKEYNWETTQIQLRKISGELQELGFKKIRCNKKIKEQYNVDAEGYPFLIVRNE